MTERFIPQAFPLVAVKPTTGKPFLVIGWKFEPNSRPIPRPVVVPLDTHGGPEMVYETTPLDYLAPGEDVDGYLAARWERKTLAAEGDTSGA